MRGWKLSCSHQLRLDTTVQLRILRDVVRRNPLHAASAQARAATSWPFTEVLAALQRTGHPGGQAVALFSLGRVGLQQGRTQHADTLLNQALSTARDAGNRLTEAQALTALGELHHTRCDLDQATACLTEAIAICRDIRTPPGTSNAPDLTNLGLPRLRTRSSDNGPLSGTSPVA